MSFRGGDFFCGAGGFTEGAPAFAALTLPRDGKTDVTIETLERTAP